MPKHRQWKRCQSKSDRMKVSHYWVNSINRGWLLTKLGQAKKCISTDMWKKTCNHIVERECGYSTSCNRLFMKHQRIGQRAYIELWMHAWSWRAGTSKSLNTKLTVLSTSFCIPQTSKETGLYHSSPIKFSIWYVTLRNKLKDV